MQWWDALTGLPCHQLSWRSPSHAENHFALCWRCSGIYLGVAASVLWVAGRTRGFARPPSNAAAIICVLLMLPLIVDGWGQVLDLWQSGAGIRFVTGWAMGISFPPLCMPLLTGNDHASYRRSIGGALEWLVLAAAGIFAWNLLRISSETVGILLRVSANFGQIFLLITFAGAVVMPLLRKSCSYVRQNLGRHLGL